jgi:hypothetical protein
VLGATGSAVIGTAREVFDRHAHALGDGSLDGLIRVRTVRDALQDNR